MVAFQSEGEFRVAGNLALAEVCDAGGHANVRITSGYLHVAVENDSVGLLFG